MYQDEIIGFVQGRSKEKYEFIHLVCYSRKKGIIITGWNNFLKTKFLLLGSIKFKSIRNTSLKFIKLASRHKVTLSRECIGCSRFWVHLLQIWVFFLQQLLQQSDFRIFGGIYYKSGCTLKTVLLQWSNFSRFGGPEARCSARPFTSIKNFSSI